MDSVPDVSVACIGWYCADGLIDGHHWAYSARHEQWRFSVTLLGSAGFDWIEPWHEDCHEEMSEARVLQLVTFGVEAYRDRITQLVTSLGDGAPLPEWASDDMARRGLGRTARAGRARPAHAGQAR